MRLLVVALILAVAACGAQASAQTTRQFIDANCKSLTNACTDPIAKALNDAAKAGKIPAKCAANRPPMAPVALDIALWLSGHHDLDNKPLADSAVITAEKLWPCSRAM